MKKTVVAVLIFMIAISSVFAYQKTYRLSSDEVQDFLLLRKVTSSITPDPTYPITASQLSTLVKSIDTSKLSGQYVQMYNNLLEKLEHPEVLFGKNNSGYDVELSVVGLQTIKGDDLNTYKILPYKDRLPMAELKGSMYISDYAFGLFDFDFRPIYEDDLTTYTIKNILDYANTWPGYAYFSVGNERLNLIVGRDRLAAGNGYTGNLELGENHLYQDFAKISAYSELISYDFTIDSWRYDPLNDEGYYENPGRKEVSLSGPKKTVYLHRLSFNLFELTNLTIYEGALFYSEKDFINLKALNPFMFMHQTGSFWTGDTNNFAGFEVLTNIPWQNLQLDVQLFLDQINLPGIEDSPEKTGENAFAALVNLSKTFEVKDGIADVYAEAVYGNPYVYLKNRHGYGIEQPDQYRSNLYDLVVDNKLDYDRDKSRDPQYLGYKYGGDLLSFALGGNYRKEKLKLTADFQYLKKGTYGIREGERREALGREEEYQTSFGNKKTYKDIYETNYSVELGGFKNIEQTTYMFNVGANYTIFKGIDLSGRVGYLMHTNYKHDNTNEENKKFNDFQFAFSVNIKPLELADKWVKKHNL